MKVGTICKLKVDCLGNKAGTLGVVFNDYGDGFQVIFENGGYDGFSRTPSALAEGSQSESEAERFLEEIGFEESLAAYPFKNVMQVSEDYRSGVFNIGWRVFWQKAAEQIDQAVAKAEAEPKPAEYEKCEVCIDEDSKWPFLYFKRDKDPDSGALYMLSAAMDYADFSHFEYAKMEKSLQPRWFYGKETIYPKYVVFRKKL